MIHPHLVAGARPRPAFDCDIAMVAGPVTALDEKDKLVIGRNPGPLRYLLQLGASSASTS
jgi:hypothetical protein